GDTNAVYAPGGDGREYLLWMRSGTLVAQEFNSGGLQLVGEPYLVADPIGANPAAGMNVAASSGGVLLYSATNTTSQLSWFDRAGKPAGVAGEPGEYSMHRLSPDGRRVAVARAWAAGHDLWLLDAERGGLNRLTLNPGARLYPVWSPDGRSILFASGYPRNLY